MSKKNIATTSFLECKKHLPHVKSKTYYHFSYLAALLISPLAAGSLSESNMDSSQGELFINGDYPTKCICTYTAGLAGGDGGTLSERKWLHIGQTVCITVNSSMAAKKERSSFLQRCPRSATLVVVSCFKILMSLHRQEIILLPTKDITCRYLSKRCPTPLYVRYGNCILEKLPFPH